MKHNKESRRYASMLQEARNYFETLASEREDKQSSRSEKWQESEAGEQYVSDTDSLQDIASAIEEVENSIDSLYEID